VGGIEDPIYKCSGLLGRKFLGQADRFIQNNLEGRLSPAQLMNPQPQNGAVDGCEPFESPILGMLHDHFVERGNFLRGAFKKTIGKLSSGIRGLRRAPEFGFEFRRFLRTQVPLKQHLHGKLAGFGAQ